MIEPDIINAVQKLLLVRPRLTYSKIASTCHISRMTVKRIALGERVPRQIKSRLEDERKVPLVVEESRRCSCGALVYGECLACSVKALKKRGQLSKVYDMDVMSEGSLDYKLSVEQRRRLQEVLERAEHNKELSN